MLIVSKHKDYYDSAVGLGIDKTIVYKREINEVKLETGYWATKNNNNPKVVNDIMDKLYPYTQSFSSSEEIGFMVISFCGKIYISFIFKNVLGKRDKNYNDHIEIIYDKDEIIEKYLKVVNNHNGYWFGKSMVDKKGLAEFNNIWNDTMNMDTTDVHREYNSPIFLIQCMDRFYHPKFTINPILKDYDFVRIYDPYTAFQEIQMYLSGVLASGDDIPDTEMNEKQKVNQHGFDDKYGFRTRPGKGKKKRK